MTSIEHFCTEKDPEICNFLSKSITPYINTSLQENHLNITKLSITTGGKYRFGNQELQKFQGLPRLHIELGDDKDFSAELIAEYFATGSQLPSYFYNPRDQAYERYLDAWEEYFSDIDESVIIWEKGKLTAFDLSPTAIGGVDILSENAYFRLLPNERTIQGDPQILINFFSSFEERFYNQE